MTIDERLEALTHTVELLAQMHMDASKEYEERFRANEERFRANEERFRANEERFRANEVRLAQLMDTMNRLGRILEIHDRQTDDHEQRLDHLEEQ